MTPPAWTPEGDGDRLPVFPLGVVLFPGTPLPLHLFEPRYRQLLADIEQGDRRFAILTAIPGVGERDLPAGRVGCVAQLTDVDRLPDGRANIIVVGGPRFALQRFVADPAPYHVADVTWVTDTPVVSHVALAVTAGRWPPTSGASSVPCRRSTASPSRSPPSPTIPRSWPGASAP